MIGLERRLARLEVAAGGMAKLPLIFVRFVRPDGTEPSAETVTINDSVWHRAGGETEAVFLARVRGEAKPIKLNCCMIGFLA